MSRSNRKNKNRHNWNSSPKGQNQAQKPVVPAAPVFRRTAFENPEDVRKRDEGISELKKRTVICAKCGQPITEIANAIADKATGAPVHFDCVLDELKKTEKVGENERITYIGQGRFAVLHFENMRDLKQFKIIKVIEWEQREKTFEWRDEVCDLFSQIL